MKELLHEAGVRLEPKGELLSGPWEDASVYKISGEIALVENVDFFTPIVDEPAIQGEIAACNVTNDIYAMASTKILYALAILGVPSDMPREIATDILRGFSGFLNRLGISLAGGQTIINMWPIIGGCALGVCHPGKIIYTCGAKPGDILVLTKPLGIQPAMAAYRLRKEEAGRKYLQRLPEGLVENAISKAVEVMTTSNRPVAEVMQQVPVNAATDVTGFGLKGHAQNMAEASRVDIEVMRMVLIEGTPAISELLGYPLLTGETSETAGGMLISVSRENLDDLLDKLEKKGVKAHVIGKVKLGSGNVVLVRDLEVIET